MFYFNSFNLTFDIKQKYSNIMENEILEATKIIQFFLNFLSKSQVSPTVREMIPCARQLIYFILHAIRQCSSKCKEKDFCLLIFTNFQVCEVYKSLLISASFQSLTSTIYVIRASGS